MAMNNKTMNNKSMNEKHVNKKMPNICYYLFVRFCLIHILHVKKRLKNRIVDQTKNVVSKKTPGKHGKN